MHLLAWRPFLDPMDVQSIWFVLLIPTAFFLSMAYRGVRLHKLDRYWLAVLAMTIQIIAAIVGLGAAFYALIEWFLPVIVPMKPL
ncbi:MAG: hypothetical protein AAGK04_05500 [Planctomycetota bacterium]